MKPKLTLEQLIARDAAALEKKKARLAARTARKSSKDVRKLEADLKVFKRYRRDPLDADDETIESVILEIENMLKQAREAVK